MAEIFPFAAYRYHPGRVALGKVVTQPYDKITGEMQERYYGLSPYNLIPVEKGKVLPDDTLQNNVYTRAAQTLEAWIAEGIVVRDAAPAIYAYSQEYSVPGAQQRLVRRGFIALSRVEDYDAGVVFRHERTHAGPKADRLELLRHTRVQTGQLFMLYSDPQRRIDELLEQIARVSAPVEVRDEYDVVHRLWPIVEPKTIHCFVTEMAGKKLVIADGHHRYETALAYRNECRARHDAIGVRTAAPDRNAPYENSMMTFFNTHGEGLTILPTHRVISGLTGFNFVEFRKRVETVFEWYSYPFADPQERATSVAEFRRDLTNRGRHRHAIGVHAGPAPSAEIGAGGAFYLFLLRRDVVLEDLLPGLSPLERQLDVVLLHRVLLEKGLGLTAEALAGESLITYEREMDAALAAVDERRAQLCCLLNPVRVEQVCEIALSGGVMPQKSTDFYPKLLSGLLLYRMEG